MSTHRYWRAATTLTQSSNVVGLEEVEFRASAGGADLTGSGTAMGTNNIGEAPSQAFDNNTVTFWAASAGLANPPEGNGSNHMAWVGYDFGAGTPVDVREVLLRSRDGFASQAPYTFFIQFSDDATNWVTVAWYDAIAAWSAGGESRTFAAPEFTAYSSGASRYWRFKSDAPQSGSVISVGECEFHDVAGGPWLSFGGTPSHSDTINSVGATCFDGYSAAQSGDFWAGGTATSWIQYDFGAGVKWEFAEVRICSRSGFSSQCPKDFKIQDSDDGSTWRDRLVVTGEAAWGNYERRTYAIAAIEPDPVTVSIAATLSAVTASASVTVLPLIDVQVAATLSAVVASATVTVDDPAVGITSITSITSPTSIT